MKTPRVVTRAVILLGLLVAFSGCQSLPQAQSERSPQARFAEYKTFAVLPPGGGNSRVDPADRVRLSGPLRMHLETTLQRRGLVLAAPDAADVVFEIIGSVSTEIDYKPAPASAGYRWGWSSRYPLYTYYTRGSIVEAHDRGVLSVIAYDHRAKAVVWAGWMEGRYQPGAGIDQVTQALDALVAQFPRQ